MYSSGNRKRRTTYGEDRQRKCRLSVLLYSATCLCTAVGDKDTIRISAVRPSDTRNLYVTESSSSATPSALLGAVRISDGRAIPDDFKDILIEIGANDYDVMQDQVHDFTPYHFRNDEAPLPFLLSFEPLIEHYNWLLQRIGGKAARFAASNRTKLTGYQHPRGMAFPYAAGCDSVERGGKRLGFGGDSQASQFSRLYGQFFVTKNEDCSSLMKPNGEKGDDLAEYTKRKEIRGCVATKENQASTLVPCINLSEVIIRWLGLHESEQQSSSKTVKLLKVDAQGFDVQVLESADSLSLLRNTVQEIQLEVLNDEAPVIYEGQPRCKEVKDRIENVWKFGKCDMCTVSAGNADQDLTCVNEELKRTLVEKSNNTRNDLKTRLSKLPTTEVLQLARRWPLRNLVCHESESSPICNGSRSTTALVELGSTRPAEEKIRTRGRYAYQSGVEDLNDDAFAKFASDPRYAEYSYDLKLLLEPSLPLFAQRHRAAGDIAFVNARVENHISTSPADVVLPIDVCTVSESSKVACIQPAAFHRVVIEDWFNTFDGGSSFLTVHLRIDYSRFASVLPFLLQDLRDRSKPSTLAQVTLYKTRPRHCEDLFTLFDRVKWREATGMYNVQECQRRKLVVLSFAKS